MWKVFYFIVTAGKLMYIMVVYIFISKSDSHVYIIVESKLYLTQLWKFKFKLWKILIHCGRFQKCNICHCTYSGLQCKVKTPKAIKCYFPSYKQCLKWEPYGAVEHIFIFSLLMLILYKVFVNCLVQNRFWCDYFIGLGWI